MSAIVPSTRGGVCGICLEEFKGWGSQVTHEGGEGHDGFHRLCLKRWLEVQTVCPIEGQIINRSSLILTGRELFQDRIELFWERRKLFWDRYPIAMSSAIMAACWGITAVSITIAVQAGKDRRGPSGAIISGISSCIILQGGDFLARAAGGGKVAEIVASSLFSIAVIAVMAGTGGVDESTPAEVTAVMGAGVTAIMGLVELGAAQNDIDTDVGYGMVVGGMIVGGMAPLVMGGVFNNTQCASRLFVGLPLVAGVTAGILSFIRRQ